MDWVDDCFRRCGSDLECHNACIDGYVDSIWEGDDPDKEFVKSLLKMHALMVVCVTHHVASRVGQALIRSYVKLRREMVGVLYPQNGGVKE